MEVTDDEFPAGVDKPEDQEVPDLELPDEEDIDKLVSGVSDGLSSPLQLTHAFSETDSAVEQSIYDRALWDARQSCCNSRSDENFISNKENLRPLLM